MKSFYEKLLEPKFALTTIVVIASVIRTLPLRFRYLLGYDPYFHLAYIRYSLEKGEWASFFPYAFGPWGIQIKPYHPLGLWMVPAYVYKLLSVFGVSLYNAFRITPVLFGVLTVVFVYISALKLYNRKTAFLSGLFLAVSFAHVFRSMAGYYRGDNYMLFWYSAALLGTAIAISQNGSDRRYNRLALYIIPAVSAGLASAFWQAYYPVFIIVLANAILIGIGAFLLRKDEYIIDGLVLAGGTAIGALLANWVGNKLGYGMAGYNRWVGIRLAEELGLHGGRIKDAFLLLYLKYILPLAILALLILFILSRLVKRWNARALIIVISITALVLISFIYLRRYLNVFMVFPNEPNAEAHRTSIGEWWMAYGITGFLTPLFFLRFFRRPKIADFLVLGTLFVLFPMALLWARFLFMASLGVALASGIGLVELLETINHSKIWARKSASFLLILLLAGTPVVATYQGFEASLAIKPIMNPYWETALEYLGNNSNINDVVLTWWDQGHWVTYYAMRAPVAQGGISPWVAEYYLGMKSGSDLMSMGVDYVIVSYDTILKFGSILETAKVRGDYLLVLLYGESTYGKNTLMFSNGPYLLIATSGKRWKVKVSLGNRVIIPRRVFVEKGKTVSEVPLFTRGTYDIYAYINLNYGYAVIMNSKTFNTPLAKLTFTNEYPKDYKLMYSDGGIVKIFRFVHPNVAVTASNGSVVLRFSNSTDGKLVIYGFLDNGTMVFKGWYNVKGKEEFVLPKNLNGSVVVRYVYMRKKTTLDRGVFRIDDVLEAQR